MHAENTPRNQSRNGARLLFVNSWLSFINGRSNLTVPCAADGVGGTFMPRVSSPADTQQKPAESPASVECRYFLLVLAACR